MAFVYGGGQLFEDSGGAFSVRGSTVVLVIESGQVITDPKGLVASDFKIYGDLAADLAKRKNKLVSAGVSR